MEKLDMEKLKQIYKQNFGEDLSEGQALELGTILLDTFRLLLNSKKVGI